MKAPLAVAFDLGGVLVDVDPGALGRHLGLADQVAEQAYFTPGAHEAVTVGATGADAFLQAAADALGAPLAAARDAWAAMVSVRPGARALVEAVASRTSAVAIWSNTDPVHLAAILPGLPEEVGSMTRRAISYELGAAKPEGAFFERALARLEVTAADVVFLDDRPENVAAARARGVRAHAVTSLDEVRAVLEPLLETSL